MTISLQHNTDVLHQPVAAFIRSSSVIHWIKEISRWNIEPGKLSFYILPKSLQTPEPAGLFVVIDSTIKKDVLTDPYGVIAGKLFVPVHASIYPQCSTQELQQILMWDLQVFHPTIGLVGFDKGDALSLEELFNYTAPIAMQWDHAHPGLPIRPTLKEVHVTQPTPGEILESIKKDLDTKSLEDIPGAKEAKSNVVETIFDAAKYGIFKGMYALTKGLSAAGNILPVREGSSTQLPSQNEGVSAGMLGQLQEWLSNNIEFIEQKRQDELQRLMKMFEENSDEALQYAIPLDSKYFDRGKAAQSYSLRWKTASFNLKNLGGGGAVDSWDIGDRYFELRNRYLASAQKAIDNGDYKRAAYIYAHLLADYSSAANVLVQGKHFREAAALYKDHLNNTKAAAECLENGGLLIESIELYKELNDTEKVADLYMRIQQLPLADKYYELTISKYLQTTNHLDAARILFEKMHEDERAKRVLLEGWENNQQSENCLKRYFDIVATSGQEHLKKQVENIYRDSPEKSARLLNVMFHIKQHYADEELANRTTEIAYEIASKKASANDNSLLAQLKQFIPSDKFLSPDVSRYTQKSPRNKRQEQKQLLKLDSSIQWMDATWHHNQLLVVGTRNQKLHLARCNWYANIEYMTWPNDTAPSERFWVISNPMETNRIIIKGSFKLEVPKSRLPKNKYFDDPIEINNAIWLPQTYAGLMLASDGIFLLDANNGVPLLHYYSETGELKKSITYKPLTDDIEWQNSSIHRPLIKNDLEYLIACHNSIVVLKENRTYSSYNLDSGIRLYSTSKRGNETIVLVSTNVGCHLLLSVNGNISLLVDLFAEEKIPSSIAFLSLTTFVLVQKNEVDIYRIKDDSLSLPRTIKTDSKIIAVLPAYTKQSFAIVEESGLVSVHEE